MTKDKIEELQSLWSYPESIDELKFKIHQKSLELEAVKANANEEININSDSLQQLLQLLELVRHERDEARDQIQKLLTKIMPSINNLSDAYNHSSSPVDSLFDKFFSPEFSNINTNTSFVQNYPHELMLSERFQTLQSVPEIDYATLMMDNMIHGKALPQKGNLLQTVMEAGPLLQTLLVANPLPVLSHMTFGSGTNLNFDNVNCSNFGLLKKRQRFQ